MVGPRCCCRINCTVSELSPSTIGLRLQLTFRKQPCLTALCVLAKVPAITKIVVTFYEFDPFAFRQAQLIGAACLEVICPSYRVNLICETCSALPRNAVILKPHKRKGHLRTTNKTSPGKACFGDPPRCLNAIFKKRH